MWCATVLLTSLVKLPEGPPARLRCHFAGARVLGYDDRHRLLAGSGRQGGDGWTKPLRPEFPFDFPDTAAGHRAAEQLGEEQRTRWQRRPPQKRPNFGVSAAQESQR